MDTPFIRARWLRTVALNLAIVGMVPALNAADLDAREARLPQHDLKHGAVVLVGDDAVAGWADRFASALPTLKVVNRGTPGESAAALAARVAEDVLPLDPMAVVLQIGASDLRAGVTPEKIADDFKLTVQLLETRAPRVPLIVCQVFPGSAANPLPVERVKALNALLLDVVRDRRNVTYVETWAMVTDGKGEARPAVFTDLGQLSAEAYGQWAAALRPIFSTLGLVAETPDPFEPEAGFVSLFNGRDLSGWGFRPTPEGEIDAARKRDAKSARPPVRFYSGAVLNFDGKAETPDGRYVVRSGKLVVTTPPEHRKIQQLWTQQEFPQDFVLKLDFRATPNTDSGVYLRGPQLQVRDYTIAGPYLQLKKYRPQDWNELEVTVRGTVAVGVCNGEVLEEAFNVPLRGPIGLEGDRGQMEYRRIRIKLSP